MTAIARDQLLGQLRWRYATKQFDPAAKVSPQDWAALEEALWLTPSSFGLQPWKFIVVTDAAVRQKLVSVSWRQCQVSEASHLVVLAIKKNLCESDLAAYLDCMAKVRGVPVSALSPLRDMIAVNVLQGMDEAQRQDWASRQVYIALGNLMTSAALLGIDTCPLEGIDSKQYDAMLDLERQGLRTIVACAVGYRAATDKYAVCKKVRFPKDQVLMHI